MFEEYKRVILITGGCGFIGSHVVRHFVNNYPDYFIINVDKLTYAGNLHNIKDLEDKPNYKFIKKDICDFQDMLGIIEQYNVDGIIHLAAESHVDNSILNPFEFVKTNVIGTVSLLQAAKIYWGNTGYENKLFYHISTDEVYGSLDMSQVSFTENHKYQPHSPYSASKASSDHFVRAYHDTYGLPVVISNCSNNYGPNQYPEKLIPVVIKSIVENKPIPVYGKGENIRDWLYVEDHVNAIDLIFHNGKVGETYNIGGDNEKRNIDLIKYICKTCDTLLGKEDKESEKLIEYVDDRLGHDLRYSINFYKLKHELGWEPRTKFKDGIEKTIKWYLDNGFDN